MRVMVRWDFCVIVIVSDNDKIRNEVSNAKIKEI